MSTTATVVPSQPLTNPDCGLPMPLWVVSTQRGAAFIGGISQEDRAG